MFTAQYILESLHKHTHFIFKGLMHVSWNFNDVTQDIDKKCNINAVFEH